LEGDLNSPPGYDPCNLWLERGASPNPKDKVDNALHKAVCAHRVALPAASMFRVRE
jgi:hypothetical protein